MGYFTWTLANKELKKRKDGWGYLNSCKFGYKTKGYIALPKGSENLYNDVISINGRSFIQENRYDGYGIFGSHDVFDVIVDMNKGHLANFVNNDKVNSWAFGKKKYIIEIADAVDKVLSETEIEKIAEKAFKPIQEKAPWIVAKEWKRHLGIAISDDENNKNLPYPLKIVDTTDCVYEDLPISYGCQ